MNERAADRRDASSARSPAEENIARLKAVADINDQIRDIESGAFQARFPELTGVDWDAKVASLRQQLDALEKQEA